MTKLPVTRALWTILEAESCLQTLLTKLTEFEQHLPEKLDRDFLTVLDEFNAAKCRVEAVKHDLIICMRAPNEN